MGALVRKWPLSEASRKEVVAACPVTPFHVLFIGRQAGVPATASTRAMSDPDSWDRSVSDIVVVGGFIVIGMAVLMKQRLRSQAQTTRRVQRNTRSPRASPLRTTLHLSSLAKTLASMPGNHKP